MDIYKNSIMLAKKIYLSDDPKYISSISKELISVVGFIDEYSGDNSFVNSLKNYNTLSPKQFTVAKNIMNESIGCKSIKNKLDAPMDTGFITNPKSKGVSHIWTGYDTFCRMYSTNGLKRSDRYVYTREVVEGKDICLICIDVFKSDIKK